MEVLNEQHNKVGQQGYVLKALCAISQGKFLGIPYNFMVFKFNPKLPKSEKETNLRS